MTIHSKTPWKDHIVNGSGNVIQQGTPLSAANLLKLEEGVANATAVTASELGAATAYSGVLDHVVNATGAAASTVPGQIYVNSGFEWANTFGVRGFEALIAGAKVSLAETGISKILLSAPPTEGTRDDLVFLEAWRDQATQEWKTRLRAVAGLDFVSFPEGLGASLQSSYGVSPINTGVQAQGGNDAPLTIAGGWGTNDLTKYGLYFSLNERKLTSITGKGLALTDVSLYIAGDGTEASKSTLKTYDGYVYAIPLFKVTRRNSGGYSANNPNGAKSYVERWNVAAERIYMTWAVNSNIATINSIGTIAPVVGDYVKLGSLTAKIVNISGSTVTLDSPAYGSATNTAVAWGTLVSDRPDGLFPNIIADRDITDLRHKTFLVAPSYSQMLIDGTDQILRGASQIERKKAMRKTYVGVRKTPLDSNHVFYASLDGTETAEVGGLPTYAAESGYGPMPTGAGSTAKLKYTAGTLPTEDFTLDFIVNNLARLAATTSYTPVITLSHPGGASRLERGTSTTALNFVIGTKAVVIDLSMTQFPAFIRVRKTGNFFSLYVNGSPKGSNTTDISTVGAASLSLNVSAASTGRTGTVVFADVSLSSIDRGATFATLPADYIQGYADITPALNYQRRVNSDAQTSQKTYAAAKVKNATQEPGITVTKGTGTNTAAWEAGDKIKLRGLNGEIISGVIDTDTALGRAIQWVDTFNVIVDDVSKLAVNDTFVWYNTKLNTFDGSASRVITAINTTTKQVTFTGANLTESAFNGGWNLFIETTASTSSPVVRAIISGTSTTVPGTWSALGTNEAEVTLGALPGGLAAQDIIIEYSLNMPAGQGGLYQVYTKTLGGEANGKKLIPGAIAAFDDFAGKITASTVVNPHKAYSAINGLTATPSAPGTEFSQADYDAVKTLDNSLKVVTTLSNGGVASVLVSFDFIRIFEDKYGKITGAYTIAEKVTWLKANVGKITCAAWVYGSGPAGNKASLTGWNFASTVWSASPTNNVTNTVTRLAVGDTGGAVNRLDANGFVHYIAYSEPSDGITPSTLYIDQISIELEVTTKTGYDTLVPENPRRDNGLAGVLYVRRQTREVESLFPGNDEDNGIVVIGEYVPTQEMAGVSGAADLLLGIQGFITTAGTNKAAGSLNQYANAVSRLLGLGDDLNYKIDPQSLISSITFETDGGATPCIRYWSPDTPIVTGIANASYTDGIPAWAKNVTEFLTGLPSLVLYNGEILLKISLRKRSALSIVGLGGGTAYYFRLPGRPLIKN